MQPKYVIITPAFNEESRIKALVESVSRQTILPAEFIIVDDSSRDGTFRVASELARQFPWIRVIRREKPGGYDLEDASEAKAFLYGLQQVDFAWDFLSKLDADITLESDYFARLLALFDQRQRLGIASGACFELRKGCWVEEKVNPQHVRGAARVYRAACYKEVDGIVTKLGWDVVDLLRARIAGWETRCFPELQVRHHVATGTKAGFIRGRLRSGREENLLGTHPLFLFAKLIGQSIWPPRASALASAPLILWGYVRSLMRREKRVVTPREMRHLRKEQMSRFHIWPSSKLVAAIQQP
jgi:GT2 family glycosyltransferase